MTTPDLTPTLREALEKALRYLHGLTPDEWDALTALRDACPKPRWLPTEDGLAVYVDAKAHHTPYYVRDGKVGQCRRPDGTLPYSADPAIYPGTWEPFDTTREATR